MAPSRLLRRSAPRNDSRDVAAMMLRSTYFRPLGGVMPTNNANPYLALGVRPFINCCSVRTMHGGSLMLPQVRAAMDAASRQFVNLDELMEAAGKRIAELTGA